MRRTAIAVLSAAALILAQPLTPPTFAQVPGQAPAMEPSLSIDFPGGTVTQYVEALKKSGKPVNVVTSERAAKQQLAPISLSQVNVGVAVYAIQAASTSASGQWRIEMIHTPGPRMAQWPTPGDAYSVDFFPFGKRGEDVVVESYSLQRILRPDGKGEGADPKIVLTAIETGLHLQNEGGDQPPDLKFHADSGLLFVRGSNADVKLVGSIVNRMSDDAGRRATAAERRSQEDAMRNIATKEAQLEIQLREMEVQAAQQNMEQVKALASKGTAPATEVTRSELEFARAKFNLDRAKLGLERAQIMRLDAVNQDQAATLEDLAAQNAALRKQLDDSKAAIPKSPARPGTR